MTYNISLATPSFWCIFCSPGKIMSTDDTYKYHMQIQEDGSGEGKKAVQGAAPPAVVNGGLQEEGAKDIVKEALMVGRALNIFFIFVSQLVWIRHLLHF